jgi:hypothetical protein
MVVLRPNLALGVVFNVVLYTAMNLLPFISSVLTEMLGGSPVHHIALLLGKSWSPWAAFFFFTQGFRAKSLYLECYSVWYA